MRIPTGDLVPARRGRRRGGYGRGRTLLGRSAGRGGAGPGWGGFRRRHRAARVVTGVVLMCGGALAVGYAVTGHGGSKAPHRAVRTGICRPAAPVPAARPVLPPAALPSPSAVSFRLLNGTTRNGLGRAVGNALAARGFRVSGTGTAAVPLPGLSRVYYGPGARPAALLLQANLMGARVFPLPAAPAGALELELGSTFVRVRTPAEAAAAVTALLTVPTPQPDPAPLLSPCP